MLNLSIIYYLTFVLFLLSSETNHTLFQSYINPKTKPYISHQSYKVLKNNSYNT